MPFTADKGQFDVLFEASGNDARWRALDALRPRGVIVQVGLGGDMTLPINTIVAKEFDLRGASASTRSSPSRWNCSTRGWST